MKSRAAFSDMCQVTLRYLNRSNDVMKKLRIYSMNGKIQDYRTNWLNHLGRMEQDRIPNYVFKYTPRGRIMWEDL